MRHGYKKIKFRAGKDSTKMLLRKLANNFIKWGKITTTEKRARVLKSYIEKLVKKAKEKNEANKNFLLKALADRKIIKQFFDEADQLTKGRSGGYVKITKLHQRISDGAMLNKLEWTSPVVKVEKKIETKKEVVKKT